MKIFLKTKRSKKISLLGLSHQYFEWDTERMDCHCFYASEMNNGNRHIRHLKRSH